MLISAIQEVKPADQHRERLIYSGWSVKAPVAGNWIAKKSKVGKGFQTNMTKDDWKASVKKGKEEMEGCSQRKADCLSFDEPQKVRFCYKQDRN